MPDRVMVVSSIPGDVDDWVYRRFIDSGASEIAVDTFTSYNETTDLLPSQWELVKQFQLEKMRGLFDADAARLGMQTAWPGGSPSGSKSDMFPPELLTCVWPIGGGMADAVVRVADEEKRQRRDDGMRKQLESDRQHAQLDLPREVTNRKARRAAAAARRKRQ